MLDDLHSLFGLQERDEKKQSNGKNPVFPLNQLTWPEIARMVLIATICKEMSKSDEEVILFFFLFLFF